MPNLRGKEWTTTTPANVEDAQYWEDHLISDEDAAKIGTVILPAGGTVGQVLTKQSSSPNDADWDDPASSGHTIEDEDGVVMPYQSTLQFVSAEVTNDSANGRTVVDCKGAKGDAATVDAGTVTTLPAGSSATVVNSGTTSDAVFDFGIPRGADGTDGTDGEDGFSPAVTITSIPGGHQVNITDAEHPQGQSFNVMDGSGSGDMQASAYDPNSDVYNAGGIPDYVDDKISTAISGKADKVSEATNGNFAGLDSYGNLTDSGKKASDFLPSNTPIPDEVTANPQGTATGTLTKLGIGSDIYDIQSGGGSTVSIAETGTASASSTRKQQLTIDGVNTDINGTKYFEQTINAQANTDTTFTFSSSELTYASVLDIFAGCKTADYAIPTLKSKTLSVSGSTGTLTLVYNVPTAYALTVRVYIRG